MLRNNGRHNFRSPFGIQPSLVLDFAGTGTLDPRVTFTRSTTGTYYNSSGVLSTAAINAPRFDYNPSTLAPLGLLIEQSSTNLFLQSQTFTNGQWRNGSTNTVVDNATTAPDGTTTASSCIPSAVAGQHFLYQNATITGSIGTITVYAEANGYTNIFIGDISGGTLSATYDLTAVTATVGTGSTATITSVGSGWYRLIATSTANFGTKTINIQPYPTGATLDNYAPQFTGDGVSGCYLWGAQVEALAFPTSYIPTTSAQVTRAADTPPLPISTWYNTSQGTWFAQVNMLSTAGTPRIVGATPSYKAPILISSQAAAMFDSTTTIATANTITANTTQKIATAWTDTTGLVCLNGGTVASGSQSTGYADLSTIGIGYNSTSNNNFINGRIAKIIYYPTALTSAQLQAITGP